MKLDLRSIDVEVDKKFLHIPLIHDYKSYIKKIVNDRKRISIITITEMPNIDDLMKLIETELFHNTNESYARFYFTWRNIKWCLTSFPKSYISKIEEIAHSIDFRLIKGILPVELLQCNSAVEGYTPFQTPNNMFPIQGENVYSVTYTYDGFVKYNPSVELLETCIENIIGESSKALI